MKKSQTLSMIFNFKAHKNTYKWLFAHTKKFIPALILIMCVSVFSSGTSIAMTLLTRNIIDTATAGRDFTNSVWIYIAVLFVSLVLSAGMGFVTVFLNERFAFSIRIKIYNNVMSSCWSYISKYHTGDVITRLSSDVDIVAIGIAEVIPSIFSLGITLVAAFATLAYFDMGIALFALALAPITVLIGVISGRVLGPVQEKIQQSESAYKSFMQESVANLAVFKSFGAEQSAAQRVTDLRGKRIYWVMKKQKITAISASLLSLFFQASYISVFVYSSLQLSKKLITYGTMSIFLTLVAQIQGPVVSLSRLIPRVVAIITSTKRIMEIDNMPSEDMSVPDIKPDEMLGISVKKLTFAYDEEEILRDTSIQIKPGEFVAMMGSSGIGKTTFIRLAMAYLTPTKGDIELFADGGKSYTLNAGARKYISYVPQGNTLISGRIIDNIKIGAPDITEEEIWKLLKLVAIDEFVKNAPQGLYTQIGERGLGLSEGQAQRIALCRALAKNAPILILDEATSALDEATEISVLRHLREHVKGITCLLITHRKSVLKYCERCICIDDKKIKEYDMSF